MAGSAEHNDRNPKSFPGPWLAFSAHPTLAPCRKPLASDISQAAVGSSSSLLSNPWPF